MTPTYSLSRKQTQRRTKELSTRMLAVASTNRPKQQLLRLRARRAPPGAVDIEVSARGGAAIAAIVALSILVTAVVVLHV